MQGVGLLQNFVNEILWKYVEHPMPILCKPAQTRTPFVFVPLDKAEICQQAFYYTFFFLSVLRNIFLVSCVLLACSALFPVLWHLWIYAGSANSNFYYAITLLFNFGQVKAPILISHFNQTQLEIQLAHCLFCSHFKLHIFNVTKKVSSQLQVYDRSCHARYFLYSWRQFSKPGVRLQQR